MTDCTALVCNPPFPLEPRYLTLSSWVEMIPQALDYASSYAHSPSTTLFRARGRFKQGVLYYQPNFFRDPAEAEPGNRSPRDHLRLHGTYTVEGALVIPAGEKGVFVDCLG